MDFFGPVNSPFEKFLETDNLSYLYHHPLFDWVILIAYFAVLGTLAIYGLHRYCLVYLHHKYRHRIPRPKSRFRELPLVTVQLPIYNEMYVVERLIEAVCRLSYPLDRLEIQVLDDSTDETSRLARAEVEKYQALGYRIHYLHRPSRVGYKAGALQYGLERARGEFIAVFDADFLPHPETLRQMIDYFTDPQVGMVQLRWDHLNRDYSLLTQVQSILLDGHFILESSTRFRSGRFFNFNGTAGMWRRRAIEDAGGWELDTLTEDLDLSYRAQMKGWKFIFLQDVTCPGEVPVEVNSFKSQQYRWAKGSIQTGKKLLPRLLLADFPLRVKAEAFFHLSANLAYLLMVALSLLLLPSLIIRFHHGWFELLLLDLPLFLASTVSVSSFYVVSQRELGPDWKKRIWYIPVLMSIGIGLSLTNSKAVLEALWGKPSDFVRTPKFSIRQRGDNWSGKRYRSRVGLVPLLELALGLYFGWVIYYAMQMGIYFTIPFLVLFMVGYLYMGILSLQQPLMDLLEQYFPAAFAPQSSKDSWETGSEIS